MTFDEAELPLQRRANYNEYAKHVGRQVPVVRTLEYIIYAIGINDFTDLRAVKVAIYSTIHVYYPTINLCIK